MLLQAPFYLFLTLIAATARATSGVIPLYFSFIASYGRFGFNSSDIIPAVDLALQQINSRTDLLADYELGYLSVQDSWVSAVWVMVQGETDFLPETIMVSSEDFIRGASSILCFHLVRLSL